MSEILCPGCGKQVSMEKLKVGDRIDCSNCANLTLRLTVNGGRYFLVEVPKASCPSCGRLVELPDGLRPGDTVKCCGGEYRLTYEFDSYALKETSAAKTRITKA